jgi:Putative F0F1-ATPase subunit Ca2+/Mg2+ transporter
MRLHGRKILSSRSLAIPRWGSLFRRRSCWAFFLGKLADYWLHTKWLYLVGLLFGAVVGFWQMIRMAVGAYKKDE